MSKALKKLIVDELIADYKGKKNLVVVNFSGINAHQSNELRRGLVDKDIRMKVVKNSLAVRVFKEIGVSGLEQMIEAPTAVAASDDDPVELAKTLKKYSKEISSFKIVGGWIDGVLMSFDNINTLASIPSREAVMTQLLFAIKTPLVQLANVFNATATSLCQVLNAIKEKKSNV